MIGITRLFCGTTTPGDALRYGYDSGSIPTHPQRFSKDKKPIVVWNCTRRCNLHCIHCYSNSEDKEYAGELTSQEAKKLIDDLAEFKIPVILFSGGEPLLREDIFELAKYARTRNIRPVLSTNGTLITRDIAKKLQQSEFAYVGISLDGIGLNNDKFRGKAGAFNDAVRGFENCIQVGLRVGLRLTLTKRNYQDLSDIFTFIEEEKINRACFYHLVYCGRGSDMVRDDLTHEETRTAIDFIINRTIDFHNRGLDKDILTVDNHTDGVYLYLRLTKEKPERANEVMRLLKLNGGNNSGVGIADIDNLGYVHPDQFWIQHTFGNVRERKFGDIWMDTMHPILAGLKNRKPLLKGRCAQMNCKWIDICNGNLRARAEAVFNDPWMEDPACYLTDEEIRT
ncbi:MAG: radical SAM protein [bacterium]|nr:radical SAM protein [bacterium]